MGRHLLASGAGPHWNEKFSNLIVVYIIRVVIFYFNESCQSYEMCFSKCASRYHTILQISGSCWYDQSALYFCDLLTLEMMKDER
jgi:hypothetical protein